MAADNGKTRPSHPAWAIEIHELTKSFGNETALRGINLEVRPGEFIVIFGPNGAGKSTLIRTLATIITPSSGSIKIDGLNIKDNAEQVCSRLGVVAHQTFLYSNLTIYENLDFYCRMYNVRGRGQRIQEVVDMVGMTSRLHDRVSALSRGMQQRVSIARSLLHKPTIMLLDEPETGLDQQACTMFWQALKTKGKEKRTILLTTHNLERGLELGERLMILAQGKIAFDGLRQNLNLAELKKIYQNCTEMEA